MLARYRNLALKIASFIFISGIIAPALFVLIETDEYTNIQRLAIANPELYQKQLMLEARHYMTNMIMMAIMGAVCSLGLLMLYSWNWRQLDASRTEHETLLSVINLAEDGIAIFYGAGILIYANAAFFRTLGPLGMDSLAPSSQAWLIAEMDMIREKQGHIAVEEECVLEDGRRITLALSMTSHRDGMVLVIMRDVSARKRTESEMESLQHQFYQAQKMEAIGRMAGGMAHDFNNMLAAIMGNAEFLLEDLPDGSPERSFARKIHDVSAEARDMIDQILTYSRRHDVPADQFDLAASVQETRGIIEGLLKPGMTLEWQCDDGKLPILGNASQIKQCLINLCSNAGDALIDARGTITVTASLVDGAHPYILGMMERDGIASLIDIADSAIDDRLLAFIGQVQADTPYVLLSVADTGSGMDRAVLEHIFEPFYTTKPVHEGTGLGLSAVQGIVLNHHGAAVVDTCLGVGTTIALLLPATTSAPRAVQGSEQVKTEPGKGLVLVLDDQERVLEITTGVVERMGYEAHGFTDPAQLLDAAQKNPDTVCVITDQSMPAMTGIEVTERLLAFDPSLSVIIISGHDTQSVEARRDQLPNLAGVLRKPLSRPDLAAILGKLPSRARQASAKHIV